MLHCPRLQLMHEQSKVDANLYVAQRRGCCRECCYRASRLARLVTAFLRNLAGSAVSGQHPAVAGGLVSDHHRKCSSGRRGGGGGGGGC